MDIVIGVLWRGVVLYLAAGGALVLTVCACARIRRKTRASDVIIVPGAQIWPDGQPSNCLLYRLQTALDAYGRGLGRAIIVCGAKGADEPRGEAEVMKEWLVSRGVPAARVIMEDQSVSTRTNLLYARAVMRARNFSSAVIVTSDYHMARALYIARRLSITACGVSAPSPRRPATFLKNRVREAGSWLYCLIKPIRENK